MSSDHVPDLACASFSADARGSAGSPRRYRGSLSCRGPSTNRPGTADGGRQREAVADTGTRGCDRNEATLSGKHDRADDPEAAKLLQTGPILIRGLGRGVKETFRASKPSRHRAFLDSGADDAQSARAEPAAVERIPVDWAFSDRPSVTGGGASTPIGLLASAVDTPVVSDGSLPDGPTRAPDSSATEPEPAAPETAPLVTAPEDDDSAPNRAASAVDDAHHSGRGVRRVRRSGGPASRFLPKSAAAAVDAADGRPPSSGISPEPYVAHGQPPAEQPADAATTEPVPADAPGTASAPGPTADAAEAIALKTLEQSRPTIEADPESGAQGPSTSSASQLERKRPSVDPEPDLVDEVPHAEGSSREASGVDEGQRDDEGVGSSSSLEGGVLDGPHLPEGDAGSNQVDGVEPPGQSAGDALDSGAGWTAEEGVGGSVDERAVVVASGEPSKIDHGHVASPPLRHDVERLEGVPAVASSGVPVGAPTAPYEESGPAQVVFLQIAQAAIACRSRSDVSLLPADVGGQAKSSGAPADEPDEDPCAARPVAFLQVAQLAVAGTAEGDDGVARTPAGIAGEALQAESVEERSTAVDPEHVPGPKSQSHVLEEHLHNLNRVGEVPAAAAVVVAPEVAQAPASSPHASVRPARSTVPSMPRRLSRIRSRRPRRDSIGIIVLVALAVMCAVLVGAVVQKTRSDAALAAREAAGYTPPPLTSVASTPTAAALPVVAVIGDDTTTRAAVSVSASRRWPALIASSQDVAVHTFARAGSGYVTSAGGVTFVTQAAKVPKDAKVVLFFGSANDAGVPPISVVSAATKALAAAQRQAPDAKLVVVGPAIEAGANEQEVTTLSNSLTSSATIARAKWVDPIYASWLGPPTQAARSGRDLSAADEKTIATKIGAEVSDALK